MTPIEGTNGRRLYRFVLLAFFLSVSLHFYFPLIVLFLIDKGLSSHESLVLVAIGLGVTAFVLPYSGSLLDRGRHSTLYAYVALGLVMGLGGFVFSHEISRGIFAASAAVFIVATATLYSSVRRISEGMARREQLLKAAALSYSIETAGLATAALLTFIFIERFRTELIIVDCLSSLLLAGFLWWLYQFRILPAKPKVEDRPMAPLLEGIRFFRREYVLSIAALVILVSTFAQMTGLQVLYYHTTDSAKSCAALMKIINTVAVVSVSLLMVRGSLRLSPRLTLVLSSVLISIGYFAAPYFRGAIGIVLTTWVWSSGEALFYPVLTKIVIGSYPRETPGLAVGVKDFVIRSGLVFSPLLSSLLDLSDIRTFSLVFGILPLVGGAMFISFKKLDLKGTD